MNFVVNIFIFLVIVLATNDKMTSAKIEEYEMPTFIEISHSRSKQEKSAEEEFSKVDNDNNENEEFVRVASHASGTVLNFIKGKYKKAHSLVQGFPVYVHTRGDPDIFVNSNGQWVIGKNPILNQGYAFNNENPTPQKPPENGWIVDMDDDWKQESTFKVHYDEIKGRDTSETESAKIEDDVKADGENELISKDKEKSKSYSSEDYDMMVSPDYPLRPPETSFDSSKNPNEDITTEDVMDRTLKFVQTHIYGPQDQIALVKIHVRVCTDAFSGTDDNIRLQFAGKINCVTGFLDQWGNNFLRGRADHFNICEDLFESCENAAITRETTLKFRVIMDPALLNLHYDALCLDNATFTFERVNEVDLTKKPSLEIYSWSGKLLTDGPRGEYEELKQVDVVENYEDSDKSLGINCLNE